MERANKNRKLHLLACIAVCFCLTVCFAVHPGAYAHGADSAESAVTSNDSSVNAEPDNAEDGSLDSLNAIQTDTGTTKVTITQQLPESENIEQTVDVEVDGEATGADAGSVSRDASNSAPKTGDIAMFLAKMFGVLACVAFGVLSALVVRDEINSRKSRGEVCDAECSGEKAQQA